eukprot:scaffold260_cov274-Pinguiococcus_pyrenoidosus.AAC.10
MHVATRGKACARAHCTTVGKSVLYISVDGRRRRAFCLPPTKVWLCAVETSKTGGFLSPSALSFLSPRHIACANLAPRKSRLRPSSRRPRTSRHSRWYLRTSRPREPASSDRERNVIHWVPAHCSHLSGWEWSQGHEGGHTWERILSVLDGA